MYKWILVVWSRDIALLVLFFKTKAIEFAEKINVENFKAFDAGCNQFHNILNLFNVYQIFLCPQVKQWAIITYKHGIYELPHELPHDLSLRILGNIRKVYELHRMIA